MGFSQLLGTLFVLNGLGFVDEIVFAVCAAYLYTNTSA